MRTSLCAVVLVTGAGCNLVPPAEPVVAKSMGCPVEKVQAVENSHYAGCGKKDVVFYDFNRETWSSLRDRAAFEFNCEVTELEVTVLDSKTFGVKGCDQRAVYKRVPYEGFVMNSSTERAPKAKQVESAEAD